MVPSPQMVMPLGPLSELNLLRFASDGEAGRNGGEPGGPNAEPASDDSPPSSDLPRASMPIEVRPARLADVPGLPRLQTLHRLNQPEGQLHAYSVLRDGLLAAVPGVRAQRPAFVARSGDRLIGFVQFQQLPPDRRWVALGIGASVGVYDEEPVWEALLPYAVRAAGLRGVKRLYARVPSNLPLGGLLRRSGWSAYATETIYVAQRPSGQRRSTALRRQTHVDTWAIHQLYSAVVPRAVQDAEALTSHRWDLDLARRGRGDVASSGWVLEDEHEIVGHAGVRSRGGNVLIELMFRPDRRDVLPELVDATLNALPSRSVRRIFWPVRTYQSELASALTERGFVGGLDQDLLLRYTTASVRAPAPEGFAFHVEVRDKLPQRVPTFLHGHPKDGSAG